MKLNSRATIHEVQSLALEGKGPSVLFLEVYIIFVNYMWQECPSHSKIICVLKDNQ